MMGYLLLYYVNDYPDNGGGLHVEEFTTTARSCS